MTSSGANCEAINFLALRTVLASFDWNKKAVDFQSNTTYYMGIKMLFPTNSHREDKAAKSWFFGIFTGHLMLLAGVTLSSVNSRETDGINSFYVGGKWFEIKHRPSFSTLRVFLQPWQTREGGGMVFGCIIFWKQIRTILAGSQQADQICSVHWEGDWGWLTSGGGKFELYWSQ